MALIDPRTLNLPALEQQHGLPAGLLQSVMKAESAGNPNAVSPAGAQGLFQFMPATAKAYGINPFDPLQSAVGAARMYGDLSKQYKGDVPSMLAAYNWGSGNIQKKGMQNMPQETRDYIARVQGGMGQQYAQADIGNMTDATVTNITPLSNESVVELPEGAQLINAPTELPEGAELITDLPPGASLVEPDKGFLQRSYDDLKKRGNQGIESINAFNRGEQTSAETALQVLLKSGLGTIGDWMGEGLESGYNYLPDSAQSVIKDAGKYIASSLPDSVKQSAASGAKEYQEFAKENPRATRNLESLGIGLTTLPAVKAAGAVASPAAKIAAKGLIKGGKALEKSGEAAAAMKHADFIQDLVTPKQTAKVKEKLFSSATEKGKMNRRTVEADSYQKEVMKTVSSTGVRQGNSLLKNRMIIDEALAKKSKALEKSVAGSKAIYSPSDMISRLKQTKINMLSDDPLLIGDGEKYLDMAMNKMQSLVIANKGTASGLLKARKQFDRWANSKSGFGDKSTAWRSAVRGVRNTANDYIAEMVPGTRVKQSLAKQSHLFEARDAINSKGPSEAATRLGRAVDKIPVKNDYAKAALAATGLGAVGLGTMAAPAVVIPALGAAAVYGARNLPVRKGLGKAMGATGKGLDSLSSGVGMPAKIAIPTAIAGASLYSSTDKKEPMPAQFGEDISQFTETPLTKFAKKFKE